MARLEISLLGPPQIRLDGEPLIGLASNKVRALLFYLATEADRRRPEPIAHRRETLAGLLWPDYPERSAHTNLSNAISKLRTALGDRGRAHARVRPYLIVDRETVQFDSQSDSWVDVVEFADLTGLQDLSGLEQAIGLCRGPFLEGFSLKDSPPFEQWTLVTRERLQRQTMVALSRLIGLEEAQGETERACAHARRQLELEPWHEEAHRTLMRLLALSGQRSEALAQYEACVRALKQELDVEPGQETVSLYQQICDGRVGALDKVAVTAVPSAQSSLPTWLTPFVEREDLLSEIRKRLQDPTCRLLTLVGPGGSGKTRVAVEAAGGLMDRFLHGVYFVSLAPLQAVESIVPTVAQAIGLSFSGGMDPCQQLLDYLRQRQMLLVLDNYEHLLGGAGLVEMLRAAPGVKALVTSRMRLNVQGEALVQVEGMEYPDLSLVPSEGRGEVADAAQCSAVQLYVQEVRRVSPGYQPTPEELGRVVELCRLVEGMPLAIMLAAAWADMLAPAEIAARIEKQSLEFLQTDWHDAPERQRSMRSVFDHSWHLLADRQREVLAGLSVFRGGFTEGAAAQVAGASLRDLKALMDRSLLHHARAPLPTSSTASRYDMHELLRQYAAERLEAAHTMAQVVRDRHAAYYAAALERWAADMKGPRQQAAVAEMDVEIANARVAWEWAAARGQLEWLSQGMEGLGVFHDRCGRFPEAVKVFQVAADGMEATKGGLAAAAAEWQRTLARLWAWQGSFEWQLGRVGFAGDLLRKSLGFLEGLERSGCDVGMDMALVLWQAGTMEYSTADKEEARVLLERSLALYRGLGARWQTAGVLLCLGATFQSLGFYDRGVQLARQALAIHTDLRDQAGIAQSQAGLAWMLMEQGEFSEAERLIRETLALRRAMADPFADEEYLRLAEILDWQGRFPEARLSMEIAMSLFGRLGGRARAAYEYGCTAMGEYELELGRLEDARVTLQTGLSLAQASDRQWQMGVAHLWLGCVAIADGDYVEARQQCQMSLTLFQRINTRASIIHALATLAGVALLEGHREEAQRHLGKALRLVTEYRSFIALLPALPFTARLLAEQGQAERAVEVYALASRYGYVANSRWYEDLVGRPIAEVAATLPPKIVAAAQERGRARDPWATVEELAAELTGSQAAPRHRI